MIRKSYLLALALTAVAVAAPIAQASSAPKVDPLAVSYLIGQGLSPSEVKSWTVGACSHQVKAASCYAMLAMAPITPAKSPPQGAVAIPARLAHIQYPGTSSKPTVYMAGGVTIPARLARTQYPGTSSEPTVLLARADIGAGARKPVDPLAVSYLIGQGLSPGEVTSWTVGACSHQVKAASCYAMLEPAAAASTQFVRSVGFQWGDAGIGAGATLGIILLLGAAAGGLFSSRQNRRRQIARA